MEKPESLNTKLANAVAAVASAQDAFVRAREDSARYRSKEIDALNSLDAAQKYFDSLVAEVKKQAHRETEWGAGRLTRGVCSE